jgi:hypothetical protein
MERVLCDLKMTLASNSPGSSHWDDLLAFTENEWLNVLHRFVGRCRCSRPERY